MKLPYDIRIQCDSKTLYKAYDLLEKNGFRKMTCLTEAPICLIIYDDLDIQLLGTHLGWGEYFIYYATPKTIDSIINEILQLRK